jgi:hypothetical protein
VSARIIKGGRVRAVALALALLGVPACWSGQPRGPCSDEGSIHTLCGFENPEDLEYVEAAGLVLVSNMRSEGAAGGGGFLAAFTPGGAEINRLWPVDDATGAGEEPEPALGDPACTTPPDRPAFRPHGITSLGRDGRVLVYVTAHAGGDAGREAVEIFTLSGRGAGARLVWNACIPTPESIQANDVAVGPDGTVVVSNYRPDGSLVHILKASLLGAKTGDVMAWRTGKGWSHLADTESAMANGVAVSHDGAMLFYAESMKGSIHRLPLDGSGGAIAVDVGGNPDNLSWTQSGTLLVATHTAGYGFAACLFGRRPCTTPWAVFEIDPKTLRVSKVLAHDGSLLGAVSTALQVGNRLLLGSIFDDRIGIVEVRRGTGEKRTVAARSRTA